MSTRGLESSREISLDFLRTEVDLGMTFSGIAHHSADNVDKARRNTDNARKAYDAVLRFLPRCLPTKLEADEMGGKMAQLKASLIALGESF